MEQCECGRLITSLSTTAAPDAVVFLSRLIESKVSDQPFNSGVWQHLTLLETQTVVRFLGSFASRPNLALPQKIANLDQLSASWTITSAAAEIMNRWPQAFNEFLYGYVQRSAGGEDSGKLGKTFRGFYRVLYARFATGAFAFIREEFEAYVATHWTGALGKRNRRLNPKTLRDAEWMPIEKARTALGVTKLQLNDMIERGVISVASRTTSAGRTFAVIAQADIDAALEINFEYEDLHTAASRLGVTRRRTAILIPLIDSSLIRQGETPTVWRIPKSIVNNVLQKIEASPQREETPSDAVSIGHLLRFLKWPDARIATLLSKIGRGEIDINGKSHTGRGVCKAIIPRSALKVIETIESASKGYVSVPEFAMALGVKQEVAYHLVNKGIVNVTAMPNSCGGRQIARSAVADFRGKFVFARELAARRKTSTRRLVREFSRVGVQPVCSPTIDGCRQVIFRQEDLCNS